MEERDENVFEGLKSEIPQIRVSRIKGRGTTMHKHHYHDFYEIYYMVSGSGTYFIDDKVYDISPADVVIVPPGAIHSTSYANKEHERVLLEFLPDVIPHALREKIKLLPNLYRHPELAKGTVASELKSIEREYKHSDEFSREEIIAHIQHLLVTLLRNLGEAESVRTKGGVISDVIVYIKENYKSVLSLAQLANMHFVSPEHLSRTFKRETNFGFNEFVTLIRLQKAEYLLKGENTLSIAQIAYECGFNDSNYFSEKFKRAYGMSPLQYSNMHRGKVSRNRKRRNVK